MITLWWPFRFSAREWSSCACPLTCVLRISSLEILEKLWWDHWIVWKENYTRIVFSLMDKTRVRWESRRLTVISSLFGAICVVQRKWYFRFKFALEPAVGRIMTEIYLELVYARAAPKEHSYSSKLEKFLKNEVHSSRTEVLKPKPFIISSLLLANTTLI